MKKEPSIGSHKLREKSINYFQNVSHNGGLAWIQFFVVHPLLELPPMEIPARG
jgi:hypothetical protein